jgi:hypothetical protein
MYALLSSSDFEAMPAPAGADLSPYIMTGSFCAPLHDAVLTDRFGWRFHPQEHSLDFHTGADLAVLLGEQADHAPAPDGLHLSEHDASCIRDHDFSL